ncbi:MAG: HPt protein [Parachlamydiales bacterium]|nr:HPt protein [Parachlamydiales bacterium]
MYEEVMNDDEFDKIRQIYLSSLPEKFNAIQESLEKLHQSVDLQTMNDLRFIVHKMAGMAGVYGYTTVSEICRGWDQNLSKMIASFPTCQKDLGWLKDSDLNFAKIKREFSRG